MSNPFDAVLLIAFGGPEKREDVRPFLANVLRGRRVSPERVEEVAHHYDLFEGCSPLNERTQHQADALVKALAQAAVSMPVYVGMRNWHPFLADTLAQMSRAGVKRAIGFIAAPHQSYSGCQQYKENVRAARQEVIARGFKDIEIAYVDSWFDHPGFIAAIASRVQEVMSQNPGWPNRVRVLFTAHSIPLEMARSCRYAEQLVTTARLVADRLDIDDWAMVYQSRSGRPQDPWLEPDINDYLREHGRKDFETAMVVPIGFICDHIEVLYDLDHEAAETASQLGVKLVRAETVNDDPLFIEMMADVISKSVERYRYFPILPIVSRM